MIGVTLRHAVASDAPACARIRIAWSNDTAWLPNCPDPAAIEENYRNSVFVKRDMTVAEHHGRLVGYVAVDWDEDEVVSLFVEGASRSMGVGWRLLDHAKRQAPRTLQLWTFVANVDAQRFYLSEGFREIRRAEDENEEHLPDILYRWERPT